MVTSTYPQDPVTAATLPEEVAAAFPGLAAGSRTLSHMPLFTCDDGADFRHLIPGRGTKNLFLKDKKGKIWLITAWQDSRIDLNGFSAYLREQGLAAGRLSFGSAELLQEVLGVTPGSVTPLALMNDRAHRVSFVLDTALYAEELMSCHPLRNDMTTVLAPQLLQQLIENRGYRPLFVDFSRTPPRSVEGFDGKI